LQKLLYLANLSGWNTFKDYLFYQFGLYSEGVRNELDALILNGIVSENQVDFIEDKVIYN
jgi:uncharacterized protein YwgA